MKTSAYPRRILMLLAFLGPVSAGLLSGAPIPTLFGTGLDESGALLDRAQVDPHFTITSSPDEGFPGPEAFTLNSGFPVPPWVEEGPLSRWIAPQANQGAGNAPGSYTYSTTFDLTGFDPASARITGRISADDALSAVRLNGSPVSVSAGGFNVFLPFTIPKGAPFQDGLNTLEFVVLNGGAAPNPTGFRVDLTGLAVGSSEAPTLLVGPASQTAVVGDVVNFSVEADGTPPLEYIWSFNGKPIAGQQGSTLTLTGVTTNDIGQFSVKVSNAFGSITSPEASLDVLVPFPGVFNTGVGDDRLPLPDLETDPHYRLVVNPHEPEIFSALAMDAIPSPPWVSNSNKSRWIGPVPAATAAPGAYTYRLLLDLSEYDPSTAFLAGSWATDDGGELYLNGADTGARSAGFGGLVTFNLTSGFVSGTNVVDFRVVNGGTAPNPTGLRVENLRGTAKRSVVVGTAPRVVTQPRGGTHIITTSRTFTVVADGRQPLTYQWFHGDQPVPGATSSSLSIDPIRVADAGFYRVRVSNALGSVESDPAELVVIQPEFGVYNTGVDSLGNALPSGSADPHYLLMQSPDGTYAGPYAYAAGSIPSPPWVLNDANSRWITPRPDGSETAPGFYRYRLFFQLAAGDVGTAAITADFATDDAARGVFLNGTQVNSSGGGFGGYSQLTIPEGGPFVEGLNTLDFVLENGGASANPTGLRVNNLVLTGATIPPVLRVSLENGAVRVAWLANAEGFQLQEATSLAGPWSNSSASVNPVGDENVALITVDGPAKFYRLLR